MTTRTYDEVRSFFRAHAQDLFTVSDKIRNNKTASIFVTLIATDEFSDKLERKCEKAGFTIINWTSNNHAHDIEIEVAK